jgi:hypothetical protein
MSVTGADLIEQIIVGDARYCLHRPVQGLYDLALREYKVSGLSVTGQADTRLAARIDWEKAFHVRFQELYSTPPFAMSQAEREEWAAFTKTVDVFEYTNATPVARRVIGQVLAKRGKLKVKWASGPESELEYAQAPADILGYALGRWFEAVGEYDARTGRLQRLRGVRPVPTPLPQHTSRLKDFTASLKGSSELPETSL